MKGSAQFIRPVKKTDFLKKIGKSKTTFLKKNTSGGVYDILASFGADMLEDLANRLNELNKVSSGDLISGMRFQASTRGEAVVFEFILPDYYKWVELGRKKGKLPPFEPINEWAKKKPLILKTNRFNKYGRRLKRFKTYSMVDRVQIIEAIRWGIYQRGIKPTYFFTSTVNDGRIAKLNEDLSKALKRDVEIEIIDFVKEIKK